ncbi:HDOD domain-containing protein [Methylomonas montana]|uniref:HDOD domain-containing protein n=1 Tax=Methylomonas montana TaxID=3058963 RepID=UPI00265973C5|nr:HDOD domain-containing protein [Methylomonas montana]WKJ91042.1 HDOD domain-containing protein [Methylomonas montana]
MNGIRAFFEKSQAKRKAQNGGKAITPEMLKQLFPIRNLNEEILQSFATENHVETLAADSVLFNVNQEADCAIYLLSGTVILADHTGKSYEITAGSAQSKFPICSGVKHTATATAKTEIDILRVSLKIMLTPSRLDHGHLEISNELSNNRLLALFVEHFQNSDHELEIPSLPEVAINLRKAIQKDVSIDDAVKIIQLDPAISAKLIEVANCPLYVTMIRAKTCKEAVVRIGLNATRNLVIALSLKQIFKNKSPLIKNHLENLWKQSLYLSGLCHVLASQTQQQNPESALLAGLVCDIGVIPFLNFTANLPVEYHNDAEIEQAIPIIKGPVGAVVLKEWDFAEEFIEVAKHSSNWYQNSDAELTLTDIVVLSRLHALIGKQSTADLPAISAIPAASKLKNFSLSPENTLAILHDAKAKIHEALSIFST